MPRHTFTILEEHARKLRASLLRDDNEYGALASCGRSRHIDPWTGAVEERALVRDVIAVPAEAFLERTPVSLTWSTTPSSISPSGRWPRMKPFCIAHSHPGGHLYFSKFDDVADKESFEIVFACMETERPHFSMVMDRSGEFIVRAFGSDLKPHPVDMIRIIGDRWHIPGIRAVTAVSLRRIRPAGPRLRRDGDSRPDAAARGNRGVRRHGPAIAMLLARDGRSILRL